MREDALLMQQAGFNLVRMAEFAWDRMEPVEGEFAFDWLESAIDRLGEMGIQTMLCTPTATPPAWLTHKHPEILRVDADDRRMQHGSRQHACHCNELFRRYSRRITEAMAVRFRAHPHVVGWQTDNEFHCHFSETYSASATEGFRRYLEARYEGSIEALNDSWGNAFWSQSYTTFEQIPLPRKAAPAPPHPTHWLEYKRFLNYAVTVFQHEQIAILRNANPAWWILHNGTFADIDYRGFFGQDLDVYAHDAYPMFAADPVHRQQTTAFNLDRVRSLAGNFFIPEHQSGGGGQGAFMNPAPEPGEIRLQTYQSIAHGADSILYFRWRTCRFGQETYWGGILDHDNVPRRRYKEVSAIGQEIPLLENHLLGTEVDIGCGIATVDFDVRAAEEALPLGLGTSTRYAEEAHTALYRAGFAVGCVHPADDLSRLKLYIVPHWSVFDPAWADKLKRWVEQDGGTLVLGARTATRDWQNHAVPDAIPADFSEWAGVRVEEYGAVPAAGRKYGITLGEKSIPHIDGWYEKLAVAEDVEVLAKWTDRFLKGTPAVTRRTRGNGRVVYVGTHLSQALNDSLLPILAREADLNPLRPAEETRLEVVVRGDGRHRLWFFLNHDACESVVIQRPCGFELLSQQQLEAGTEELEPFGVRIIREPC